MCCWASTLDGGFVFLLFITADADRCLVVCSFPSLDHHRGASLPFGALLLEQHPAGQYQVSFWGPRNMEWEGVPVCWVADHWDTPTSLPPEAHAILYQ